MTVFATCAWYTDQMEVIVGSSLEVLKNLLQISGQDSDWRNEDNLWFRPGGWELVEAMSETQISGIVFAHMSQSQVLDVSEFRLGCTCPLIFLELHILREMPAALCYLHP